MELTMRGVGRTSLEVSVLGLGGATLGGVADVKTGEGRAIVDAAYDAGIRYFDTAPQYGYGKSEHTVGDGLRGRADAVVSTKVGRLMRPLRRERPAGDIWFEPLPFEPVYDYSYDGVMRSYEHSLQRLGLAKVDIVFIHDPDVYVSDNGLQHDAFLKAIDSAYVALDGLRSSGEIKAIGLGVNAAQPIADALPRGAWDCFLLAGRYTLLEQAPLHSLLPEVARHGASVVVGGPFNSGILAGRSTWNYARAPDAIRQRVDGLAEVCRTHDVPLSAAALQFTLAHPVVAATIPGPRTVKELEQIVGWLNTPIPVALWQDMKARGLIDAEAPVPV